MAIVEFDERSMIKENLLNILMYVFENYLERNAIAKKENSVIVSEMLSAGFEVKEIDRALKWFTDLNDIKSSFNLAKDALSKKAFRAYTEYEMNKITSEARSFLMSLEQSGVIDPISREIVIDRAMALDDPLIDEPEIKWVSLMVLFSQADKKAELMMLEDLVLFSDYSSEH